MSQSDYLRNKKIAIMMRPGKKQVNVQSAYDHTTFLVYERSNSIRNALPTTNQLLFEGVVDTIRIFDCEMLTNSCQFCDINRTNRLNAPTNVQFRGYKRLVSQNEFFLQCKKENVPRCEFEECQAFKNRENLIIVDNFIM